MNTFYSSTCLFVFSDYYLFVIVESILLLLLFQVSRRSSSRSQSSPMTWQETAVKETSELSQLNESRQKEQSQDFEYQETGEIFPRNLCSESSANNVSAQSDASETNSLSVDKTERAGIPPKKMPISKRLLAPSFFSKKS